MNQQLIRLRKFFASMPSSEPNVDAMNSLLDRIEREHANVRFKLERTIHDKRVAKNLLNQSIVQLQVKTEELKKQKELAEQQSACRKKLFASVSHEIKTPLTGILGMLNLIDRTEISEVTSNYLDTIKSSADNLTVIINDSLMLSKLDANCIQLNNVPFSSRMFFKGLKNIMDVQAKQKNLELIMRNIDNLPEFLIGDKTRLFQIVSNIINNAIKFTEFGSVIMSADYNVLSIGKMELVLEVRDSGIGIPNDKFDMIYESFTQVHDHQSNDGLGLGLNIVKDLVKLMDGKVGVASKPGCGTTFRLVIPFTVANEKMAIGYQKSKAVTQMTKIWKEKRILLVEDCTSSQYFCKELFKNWGIPLHIASSIKKAEAMIATLPFDCMLIDLNLKDGSGFDLIKNIRKHAGKNQHTPVLITSGMKEEDIQYQLLGTSVNGFISKPYYPQDIASQLDAVFLNQKPKKGVLIETIGHQRNTKPVPKVLTRRNKRFEVKERILEEIKAIFVTEGPKALDIMSRAIRYQDWKSVCFEAHKIRSTINYVGLDELAGRTKRMEYYCNLPEAAKFVPQEFREFEREMRRFILKIKNELKRSYRAR